MDTFGNELDKLLQESRREQEETEEGSSDRRSKTANRQRQRYPARQRENRVRSERDEVPGTSRDYSGRFVDSARTPESNSQSLSITIANSRGRDDSRSRRYARSRPRGPEFSQLNNGPAWSAPANSFDYGHGSLNPTAGPTPSTSRCSSSSTSSSGLANRLDDAGRRQTNVSAAKLAEAAATANLLKVGISILRVGEYLSYMIGRYRVVHLVEDNRLLTLK